MKDTPPDHQHVCRVGILRGDDPVGNLGETDHSFGFGGVGKFSNAGKFLDFGEKFGAGDAVVCAVDLETSPLATIGFAKNGKWLGTAKQFDAGPKGLGLVDSPVRELQWESAVFPHILLKNVVVLMQFSIEGGLVPVEGYKPWVSAFDDGNTILGPTFCNMKDCEVMMMVGLPASGKTTWAEKWVKDNPEKRYVLLGTNMILEQMKVFVLFCMFVLFNVDFQIAPFTVCNSPLLKKYIYFFLQVPGLLQKHNYSERFDCLMGRANAIFDTLLYRASRTPRNYIIDQTNVFKSARKRKLRPFASFHKVGHTLPLSMRNLYVVNLFRSLTNLSMGDMFPNQIAVVVFPKPEELKIRSDKRFKEMGKEVPADAVNNMLGIPLDQILF